MTEQVKKIKFLLVGGGTMGSVSPLLSFYQEINKRGTPAEFLFVGTVNGPEKKAVEGYKIPFRGIASGKLRRYFDLKNFTDTFRIVKGFFQGCKIIKEYRPHIVIIAGSFVGVPLALAAKLKKIKVVVHQQDIEPGLANKLMAPLADKITVSFDVSLKDFKGRKVVLTGNPIRDEFYHCDRVKSLEFFDLTDDMPVILITGGGTGSKRINETVKSALPKILQFAQVIHTVGKGKGFSFEHENYHQYEFLSHEMPEALCSADLVVSRAGLSTLTELSVCGKVSVIIPMHQTHQEFNAEHYKNHNAIIYLSEPSINPAGFVKLLKDLLDDDVRMKSLSDNIKKIMPPDGARRMADEVLKLI
jgi:UDP-N-acetylglucosamine--N-acetylmuramyl-(pentapeptide) pyrophosphoryl-undecaprenol N-acetylglucosamine transferase